MEQAAVGQFEKSASGGFEQGKSLGRQVMVSRGNSIGGRRETRQQLDKALPPTPPPMPPAGGVTATSKIVSPTTSVDRGYESFQSYTSSSQPRPGRQFSSLQESDLRGGDKAANSGAMSQWTKKSPLAASSGRRRSTGRSEILPTTLSVRSNLTAKSDHYHHQRHHRNQHHRHHHHHHHRRPQPLGIEEQEAETGASVNSLAELLEDGDFFYCCDGQLDGSGAPGSGPLGQGHLSAGGLLSEYASHAYRRLPPPPQPSGGGGKLDEARALQQQLKRRSLDLAAGQQGHLSLQDHGRNLQRLATAASGAPRTNDLMCQQQDLLALLEPPVGRSSGRRSESPGQPWSQSYRRQRLQPGGHYQAAGSSFLVAKKQLTWSDQVEMAQ